MRENNFIKRQARNAQVVAACDGGDTYAEVGRQFGLHSQSVQEIYRRACYRRASPELRAEMSGNDARHDREMLLSTKW